MTRVLQIVGEIGLLSPDARLVVPSGVRRAVAWLTGERPIALTAELVASGRVRLHPTDSIRPRLDEARQRLAADEPDAVELIAAFTDRYRNVRYYPSDSRVHLTQPIVVYLRAGTAEEHQLYIEARGDHLDVMTLDVRNIRLERLHAELDLRED